MSESISYHHEKDGTLVVTVPKGTNVGRVLVQEEGTCIGSLYYPDHFAGISKMYVNLPPDLQLTCNELAIEELQLPWDKAQLSTEKTQLSTEKTQPSGKDKIFGHISRWAAIEEILDVYINAKEWRNQAIDREMQIRAESCMDACFEIKLRLEQLPSVHPETAKRIVGKSRDGMTLWYQCDMCSEPVDAQDNFCRGCGRRLTDG